MFVPCLTLTNKKTWLFQTSLSQTSVMLFSQSRMLMASMSMHSDMLFASAFLFVWMLSHLSNGMDYVQNSSSIAKKKALRPQTKSHHCSKINRGGAILPIFQILTLTKKHEKFRKIFSPYCWNIRWKRQWWWNMGLLEKAICWLSIWLVFSNKADSWAVNQRYCFKT